MDLLGSRTAIPSTVRPAVLFLCSGHASFGVLGLVELYLEISRDLEVRHETVAMILDVLRELDASRAHFADRQGDVVAVEGDVRRSRLRFASFCRVDAKIGFGRIEYQPPAADVGSGEAELVAEKRAQGVGLGRIEHCVHSANHLAPRSRTNAPHRRMHATVTFAPVATDPGIVSRAMAKLQRSHDPAADSR